MAFHLYSRGSARGIYLQNVILFPTFLGADLRWGFDAIWNVAITLNTSANVEYTTDGGVTWFDINQGKAIPALDERTFNIKAGDKDLFNLRTIDVAGLDVYRALISIAPQDIMRPRSDIDVNIQTPLPVDICPVNCPIDVNVLSVLPNPLPVNICPVTCEIDVDINSISFGDIPVVSGATPLNIDIVAQSFSPLTVTWPLALPVDICPVTCDLPVVNGATTFDVNIAGQVGANPLFVQGPQIGQPNGETILNITNSAILANTDISGTDLSPISTSAGDSVIFRILWASVGAGRLRFTLDGTNFVDFNNSVNLKGGASNMFDVVVDNADLFNLQFSNATTITFLRVVQLI